MNRNDVVMTSVLLDGIAFTNSYQRGIARYVAELLKATTTPCTLVLDGPAALEPPPGTRTLSRREHFPTSRYNYPLRAWRKACRRLLPTALPDPAIWHATYFSSPPASAAATIVTVHDLIAEALPDFHGNAGWEITRRKSLIKDAAAIIAVSQATADAFMHVYPECAPRVRVIHHGADHFVARDHGSDRVSPDSTRPFALFVGNRGGYKNWLTAIDAVASLHWPSDLTLAFVGRPFSEPELLALRYRGIQDRVTNLGPLNDERLSAAYRSAAVFVFPSMIEGFGFPILEAQAQGTPVAASDIPVFREIGGDDAFERFACLDADRMALAVARATTANRSDQLRAAGLENVKRFTWAECARKTETVWRDVSESNSLR